MTGALDPLTLWVTRGHRAARVTRFPLRASGAPHGFHANSLLLRDAGEQRFCGGPTGGPPGWPGGVCGTHKSSSTAGRMTTGLLTDPAAALSHAGSSFSIVSDTTSYIFSCPLRGSKTQPGLRCFRQQVLLAAPKRLGGRSPTLRVRDKTGGNV